ncbi:MAG: hypothetical protein WEF50_20555 [Myxococcota bacterium]
MMRCFLRFSDESNSGRPKPRPEGFSKRKCFKNFLEVFDPNDVHVVADCVKGDTQEWLAAAGVTVHPTSFGCGAASFLYAIDLALRTARSDDESVYLLEDDYLHLPRSREVLEEGLEFGDYATLYDHPDKYMDGPRANPLIRGRSEVTRLYRSASVHWKITNSTPLTFATRVRCLRSDYAVYRRFNGDGKSRSFLMFSHLRKRSLFRKARTLVSAVPGLATHVHLPWISPNPDIYALVERLRQPGA